MALPRARREMMRDGRISAVTFALAFSAYGVHGLATFAAAWSSAWPLELARGVATVGGGVLIVLGAAVYLSARLRFKGFRLAWGLRTDELVTDGVYRFSRNPQVLSWIVVLVGAGLMGRSLAALLLAGLYWLSCVIWLPIEERILERQFGETYRRYRDSVPRYVGLPRQRPAPSSGT